MFRKKQLLLLLALFIIGGLSGCKKENLLMHPYAEKETVIGYDSKGSPAPAKADLFAKDLCVIPLNSDKDEDGILCGESSLLVDITDQKRLYADNIYARVYPASVTKIVTTYVVLKYGNLKDIVTVSHKAANITEWGATKLGIEEGDRIPMNALLNAFLLYSGNDAGIALAEHVGGSEENFARMMNEEARKLGATGSNFVNAHGLHDDSHYTTAYDMYLFLNELINDDRFLKIIKMKKCTLKYEDKDGVKMEKAFKNSNRFINGRQSMPEGIKVLGGKTGTTSKAGSCLVLYSKDSKDHEYLSFLFKTENADALFSQMKYLLEKIE